MFNFKNSFPNLNSIFKISVDDQNWQQDQGARKLQINAQILRARVWTSKLWLGYSEHRPRYFGPIGLTGLNGI